MMSGRLAFEFSRSDPATNVFGVRHGFEMRGLNTSANAAQMIEFETFGDRAVDEFPCNSVGNGGLRSSVDHAVSLLVLRSSPQKAAALVARSECVESLLQRWASRAQRLKGATFLLLTVMSVAKALRK